MAVTGGAPWRGRAAPFSGIAGGRADRLAITGAAIGRDGEPAHPARPGGA